jgi:hypothetical protein
MEEFKEIQLELAAVLNRYSMDAACNTPDFVLAEYLVDCIASYRKAKEANDKWQKS